MHLSVAILPVNQTFYKAFQFVNGTWWVPDSPEPELLLRIALDCAQWVITMSWTWRRLVGCPCTSSL